MLTTNETAQVWFNEASAAGIPDQEHPDQLLWNWALHVEIEGNLEWCQARTIWEGGLSFEIRQNLAAGAQIRIRRQRHEDEPWVEFCVKSSSARPGGAFLIEATLEA